MRSEALSAIYLAEIVNYILVTDRSVQHVELKRKRAGNGRSRKLTSANWAHSHLISRAPLESSANVPVYPK